MSELTVPVIRFCSAEDCAQGTRALHEQQFEPLQESVTEISVTPWADLDEALLVLQADGFACEKADKPVARLRPGKPKPVA